MYQRTCKRLRQRKPLLKWSSKYLSNKPKVKSVSVELFSMNDIVKPILKDKSMTIPFANYLINPANEGLVGTKTSYFPKGGLPYTESTFVTNINKWEASTNWKGMESGSNMMYPVQCIDGRVHQECGIQLKEYLLNNNPIIATTANGDELRCNTGDAVYSPSFGELLRIYPQGIIHCVAPYYQQKNICDWENTLKLCYLKCFNMVLNMNMDSFCSKEIRIACPFIGTGVRNIPLMKGVEIAARAIEDIKAMADSSNDSSLVVLFVTNQTDMNVLHEISNYFEVDVVM